MNSLTQDYSTQTDKKQRWGGLLENPWISKIQRHSLDGFKVTGLSRILKKISYQSLLDVGCGLGEYSHLKRGKFVGVDNSLPRVKFAKRIYPSCHFLQGDAVNLPFKDNSFDAVLLANTAHHLSDDQFRDGFLKLLKITRKYFIFDDCVLWDEQPKISKFFYSLDRGTMFRHSRDYETFFKQFKNTKIILKDSHKTFPRLYVHAVFVVEKISG